MTSIGAVLMLINPCVAAPENPPARRSRRCSAVSSSVLENVASSFESILDIPASSNVKPSSIEAPAGNGGTNPTMLAIAVLDRSI